MNAVANWGKSAAFMFGIVGLLLLWRYGDVLMETEVKTKTKPSTRDETLARCGLGLLILGVGLYLMTILL